MLVANRTNNAHVAELLYWRQYLTEEPQIALVTVCIDKGPRLAERARAILRDQCSCWHERDRRWNYWRVRIT